MLKLDHDTHQTLDTEQVFWYNALERTFYRAMGNDGGNMIHEMPRLRLRGQAESRGVCEHRTVSKEGRIVCRKIVEGENTVSPNLCRNCPFMAVN